MNGSPTACAKKERRRSVSGITLSDRGLPEGSEKQALPLMSCITIEVNLSTALKMTFTQTNYVLTNFIDQYKSSSSYSQRKTNAILEN